MRDLTNLKTFIIDSKDPKEVDDAFSLELIEGNKKKLWIHISNPCKLFLIDSKIDIDARSKSSSLYLINQYIPMLPAEIIEKANLNQNKISDTISASIIFNDNGSINKYEIVEAKIKPKYQLIYEDAEEIIELEPKEEFEIVEIKNLLIKSFNYRKTQGSITFDMPKSLNEALISSNKNNPSLMISRINLGTYDFVQPDASVIGGIQSVLEIFNHAKSKGVDTVVHAWGGPVAIMANYHACFAAGGKLVELPMIPYDLEPDLFTDQRQIVDGCLIRPKKPGIGITMNDNIEKKYKFDESAVYSCVVVDRGQPNDDYWKL